MEQKIKQMEQKLDELYTVLEEYTNGDLRDGKPCSEAEAIGMGYGSKGPITLNARIDAAIEIYARDCDCDYY